MIKTYHIHITGIVQGVGFRPYVYVSAKKQSIKGNVCNTNDGVHIKFNATEASANLFYKNVISNAPSQSIILNHSIAEIAMEIFSDFSISNSISNTVPDLLLTPDFALCNDCIAEINNPNNKRYQYPFTTCTQCGPRFSIINKVPYDRENTSMQHFAMCETCKEEYNDPTDRRYYSQTNSCKNCAIQLKMYDAKGRTILEDNDTILPEINKQLNANKIIAVKGVGGFLLLCNATDKHTVLQLRERKHRPTKPFAVMFSNQEQLKAFADVSKEEEDCLSSSIAPIVILQAKKNASFPLNEISPKLQTIGAMLPNAPLLYLIAQHFKKPLIATSANISNSPIIYKDEDAIHYLQNIADYVVTHNREILTPQDDSVIQFCSKSNYQIIIRRARGMAPLYFSNNQTQNNCCIATGALMKSSFTIQANNKIYISQYLGTTETLEAQQYYNNTLSHFKSVLQISPTQIICDKHPQYFSTELAKSLAEKNNLPLIEVQHHKAHFAAVLAENNLINSNEPVLGVIWDGIGFGDDNQLWGGEFFSYEDNTMERKFSFDYFPQMLNDKMAKEPRLSALAICAQVMGSDSLLQPRFTETEWTIYQKILQNEPVIRCCSVGRIFDAVAALLNLCDKQNHEGEAAMQLQTLAQTYLVQHNYDMQESYFANEVHSNHISTILLFTGIVNDILNNKDAAFIAAKFHFSLVHMIKIISDKTKIKYIAFSGGVFQNALLVDMMQILLSEKLKLFFHEKLSPNDENISFGQMMYVNNKIKPVS